MITLWECEYASQIEIARSFGYSARSLCRYQERLEAGGISGLIRGPGRPSGGSKNAKERGRDQTILHRKTKGASNRTIAGKLSEKAICKRLRRLGWRPNPEPAESGLLFQEQTNVDAFPNPAVSDPPMDNPAPESAASSATPLARSEDIESAPISLDPNPLDRSLDRLLAALGRLDDASVFAPADSLPRAGVLLAVPPLVASGVLSVARKIYGTMGPAFCGLRTTMPPHIHSLGITENASS
jgi:hypothetical protein